MRAGVLRLGILGSGRGSNFQAIHQAILAGSLEAEVVLVLSDHADAGILQKAAAAGLPAQAIPASKFRTKLEPELEEWVAQQLEAARVDLVVLAGYLRLVKAPLLTRFRNRILNIHPSLLPAFPGLAAWRQALAAGVAMTGCTVHRVDEGMDTGEVLARAEVPVFPGDTEETLQARIQSAERELYPQVLAQLAARWRAGQDWSGPASGSVR